MIRIGEINYKNYKNLNEDIKKNIFKVQGQQFDLIVGIPRSGMIPSYMIALYLNVNCITINSYINNLKLEKGMTRSTKEKLIFPHEAKKVLLIDDSILSGNTMTNNLEQIPNHLRALITTLSIYSSSKFRDDVDIFFEYVSAPRVFEWNVFHHAILKNTCVDIDGVLCINPTEEENDDGTKYIDFLLNAKPLFISTNKIHTLITNRLEKYRSQTETWLKKYNIIYDNLIMLDLPSKEERLRLGVHSTHKANYYQNSDCFLFIESDLGQAREICKITKKPVLCVDQNVMYNPHALHLLVKNSRERLQNKMFVRFKSVIKKLFNKISSV